MSSDLHNFTRRKISALLEKYSIEDDALEQELNDACFAVRAWQPALGRTAAPKDARLLMIEAAAGREVPQLLREGLLKDLGDATEEQLRAARVDWVKKNPRNPDAWTWVSWAKHAGKDNRRPTTAAAQEPAGFQGLSDWLGKQGHATD